MVQEQSERREREYFKPYIGGGGWFVGGAKVNSHKFPSPKGPLNWERCDTSMRPDSVAVWFQCANALHLATDVPEHGVAILGTLGIFWQGSSQPLAGVGIDVPFRGFISHHHFTNICWRLYNPLFSWVM